MQTGAGGLGIRVGVGRPLGVQIVGIQRGSLLRAQAAQRDQPLPICSGFGLCAGLFLHRLVRVTGLTKAELDAMIEEATVECHDEEERLTGFATMVENNLEVPFGTTVLGVKVTVSGVTYASHGLVADCARRRHRQAIHVFDRRRVDHCVPALGTVGPRR
jgi:hypothetical protein